jgi:hypothetical protein
MAKWFDIGAAIFALIAALFWFLSARGELPPMVSYFDQAPASDPLYAALKFSARMNSIAAIFSGLAALCVFAGILTR